MFECMKLFLLDDENVSLVDKRYIGQRSNHLLYKSGKLGGGIWRMKWHPYTSYRMLVGMMHGGCCTVNFYDTNASSNSTSSEMHGNTYNSYDEHDIHWNMKCTKIFTEHESMVYGADWLVCPHPTQNGYFEAAAR